MAELYNFGEQLGDLLRGLLKAGDIRFPGEERPTHFPPAGVDLVHHLLRVQLDVGANGKIDETVNLHGTMLIQRGDPYLNRRRRRRQIDFNVMSWVASGWSWTLRQNIAYVLSQDVEQPTSTIVAEQRDSDFPATFTFNVIFDAVADNRTVSRQFAGKPEGQGFLVVPPDGNRKNSPTMTQFEDARIVVEHPALGKIQVNPLDCDDLGSETLVTF